VAGVAWRGKGSGPAGPLLVWQVATVMMGDIGEEITEIELEPLPEAPPPAEAPVEPTAEPAPG
jgi:hypothetical protein